MANQKDSEWRSEHFAKRTYKLDDEELGKTPIQVVVRIGQRILAQMTLGEPGMLSIISKPADSGIQMDIVRPEGLRYLDIKAPEVMRDQVLEEWQVMALELGR